MDPRPPVYLSHSYWAVDREINERFWDVFWDEGFTFAVDPRSGEQRVSVPHLELMMRRSAAFVAIAPYRQEENYYKTSPFIAFEHSMAARAQKPRLVIAESGVAGSRFHGSQLVGFRRDHPIDTPQLRHLVQELKRQSAPRAGGGDVLGSVGLVLPSNRVYHEVHDAIGQMLESAGYTVQPLTFDRRWTPDASEMDKHDFFVIDIGAQDMIVALYHRFVPAIWLGHESGTRRRVVLPRGSEDQALRRAEPEAQRVIWWSSQHQLLANLEPMVDKFQQRRRREFRTHEEGVGYFRSLGRARQGRVFISNARPQNDLALDLSRALDLNNIEFFHYQYKNTIPMGTAWEEQLLDHVRSSPVFVALITADYWRSSLCKRELKLAQQLSDQGQVRIYKYFLDDVMDCAGLTDGLQGSDLSEDGRDERLRRIVADIDRYLTSGRKDDAGPNLAAYQN